MEELSASNQVCVVPEGHRHAVQTAVRISKIVGHAHSVKPEVFMTCSDI
jgi:hypothetical protein